MTGRPDAAPGPRGPGRGRVVIWSAGIAVALGAAVATAHGLYEVAVAARVPRSVAWLYPLITDGLALVAYAATARLRGREARYAWTVVVVAAGLSGLAQAAYLAEATPPDSTAAGADTAAGAAVSVAAGLRFGVGAWPAIAAAVVAHLLYLLATTDGETADTAGVGADRFVHSPGFVQPGAAVQPGTSYGAPVQPDAAAPGVQPDPPVDVSGATSKGSAPPRALPSPARERAESAALRHARRHGGWPTVSELEAASGVSRGTAAAALKALRERPLPLHVLPGDPEQDTSGGPAATPHVPEPAAMPRVDPEAQR